MLHLQQGVTENHLFSFNPVYQSNRSDDGTGMIDFETGNRNFESFGDFGSSEIEFQAQTIEDGFEAYSPPLWKTSRSIKNEVYPLLPHNHQYSNVSPRSRRQAIAKGRGELMEMIQNMPESSYELSLKDIVDQEILQEAKQEIIGEHITTGLDFKNEDQTRLRKKKKKNNKISQISRTGSMDSGTFLLKMFLPTCLTMNTKSTGGNRSRASPRSSFEGFENHGGEWWKKKDFVADENKTSVRNTKGGSTSSSNRNSSCGSSSSSNSNNNKNRHADSDFSLGCWPSIHTKTSKIRGQKGCLF